MKLGSILVINCRLGLEWAGRLRHVQFGRVRGMSTRKGTAVFLSDILDEAFERMREKQECYEIDCIFKYTSVIS